MKSKEHTARERARRVIRAVLRESAMSRADLERLLQRADKSKRLNLSDTDFRDANFSRMDLRNTDFRFSDLQGAYLHNANLQNVDFGHANLQYAILDDADLRGADLRDADLQGAEFWRADLRGAKFGANILDCQGFAGAKFTSTALPLLIQHSEWLELKDTVEIDGMSPDEVAAYSGSNTASVSEAKIRTIVRRVMGK